MSFEIRLERLLDTTPEVAFHHWVDAAERRGWYGGDEADWTVEAETDLRHLHRPRRQDAAHPGRDRLPERRGPDLLLTFVPDGLRYYERSLPS